jgi:hypothetical protein
MCCPKGKCGCQYFILLTWKKKSWTQGSWIFFNKKIILDYYFCLKSVLCFYFRFLPSIVAEKNATKNEHICSMCIKINKVGKQEVGIWWVQKCYPQYGIPIWCVPHIVGGVFNPSDSYFLFAEERGYHRWALAHSLSISSQSILLDFHTKRKNIFESSIFNKTISCLYNINKYDISNFHRSENHTMVFIL